MECAEQAEASANQVSLFGGDDSDHGDATGLCEGCRRGTTDSA
jgi:hypothetical protein